MSRTRQLATNCTQTLLGNDRGCEGHIPMHDFHTYGDMQLPTGLASLSVMIRVGAPKFYSTGKTQKTLLGSRCRSQCCDGCREPSERGLRKNATYYYCHSLSYSLFPHPFFPSCPCNFKRSKEPEEVLCILIWRWFFRSHRGRLLTGPSAQWSLKAKVIIEVLPPVQGGRWKALNFLGAAENRLLSELRETHEKDEFPGLPSPPFRSSIPVCV